MDSRAPAFKEALVRHAATLAVHAQHGLAELFLRRATATFA